MNRSQANLFYEALCGQRALTSFIQRKRDLVILDINDSHLLILACDSNASIGEKVHDYVHHSLKEVGQSAAKVPLMEVLAVGATPFVVIDNLCVEMDPTGLGILEGIRFEVARLGLDPDLVISGSSEKNMVTTQTGLGVTVLGIAPKEKLMLGTSQPGDRIVCVGIPKNAPEIPYLEGDSEIMDPPLVQALRRLDFIHEVLPVGSHGVQYEMGILASDSSLHARSIPNPVNLNQSAGASTCVIASLPFEFVSVLTQSFDRPINVVGFLE